MAKKGSCLGTLLKVLFGIIITVVILAVAAYLILKFALGIDIIDIGKKVGALRNYDESKIVDSPYDATVDLESVAGKLDEAGLSFLYSEDEDGKISIDFSGNLSEELGDETQWQEIFESDLKLSGPEIASVVNNVMSGMSEFTDFDLLGISLSDLNFQLKQIKFMNLVTDDTTGFVSVDLQVVSSVDIDEIKNLIEKEGFGFANRFLPDKIFINSINTIVQTAECDYTVEHVGLGVNNLDIGGTSDLVELIAKYTDVLGGIDEINQTIGELFANVLIGNEENSSGFVYLLTQPQSEEYPNESRLATGFSFEEVGGEVSFVIKHNPEAGQIGGGENVSGSRRPFAAEVFGLLAA